MHRHRLPMLPGICAAIVACAAAVAVPTGALAGSTHHSSRHVSHRHTPPPRHASGIPQHDGGDHDSDNNGGPSDGDGNV